jgi:hypothetical protein
MPLEDHEFWTMTYNDDIKAVELRWKSPGGAMTGEDFKLALEHLAEHIRECSASGTLIDVRRFDFATTPELDQWRRETIIPAYNAGGLRRFAYLLPAGVDARPGGTGETDEFLTDYFDQPEAARAWLAEA